MNSEWRDSDLTTLVARSIDQIGTDEFTQSLAHLCLQTNAFDSAYIVVFFHDHAPCEIFSNLSQADTETTNQPYLSYAYLLDPFYNLFKEGVATGSFFCMIAPRIIFMRPIIIVFFTRKPDWSTNVEIGVGKKRDGHSVKRSGGRLLLPKIPGFCGLLAWGHPDSGVICGLGYLVLVELSFNKWVSIIFS